MHVNISEIEKELTRLNNNIKSYEENSINLYYIIEHSSNYWKDGKSSNFYDDLYIEKRYLYETISSIKLIHNIYLYIQNEYSKIGKQIDVSLEGRNKITNLLDNLSENANNLSDICNNINSWPSSCASIADVKHESFIIKEIISDLKTKILNKIDIINKIENTVAIKTSKINIINVKENNNDYLKNNIFISNISKAYIGKDELKKVIETASIYIKEQHLLALDFEEIAENLKSQYISKNSEKINLLFKQLIDSINLIIKNYTYRIETLNNVVHTNEEIVKKYHDAFQKIKDSSDTVIKNGGDYFE